MIYGKRIRLRADERTDIPQFTTWLNDPEVRQHLGHYLPFSLAAEEQWYEGMLKRPREEQPLAIEIRDPASADGWRLIGNCGFMNLDWIHRQGEIGLFLGEKTCWNQGYGTEVMQLLLRHGFETLNLNRISLRVDEDNLRGIHVYEKVGFVHEGRFRQAVYKDGKYQDVLSMSILRSEWNPEE